LKKSLKTMPSRLSLNQPGTRNPERTQERILQAAFKEVQEGIEVTAVFACLTFALVAIGVIFATAEVTVIALTAEFGSAAAASLVLSGYAVGSLFIGLVFGALKLGMPLSRQFATAITVAAARYGRKFRWFGGNAPPQYLSGTPNSTDSSQIDWTTNTTSYEVPAQSAGSAQLQLDSVYEGIGSGARILVISDYALTTVLTVTGSAQGAASVGQITAATSILSVAEAVPHICDLRSVSMYELLGPDIPFLTMNYPDAVAVSDVEAGATIFQSGRRVGMKPLIERSCLPASKLPATCARAVPVRPASTVSFHSG